MAPNAARIADRAMPPRTETTCDARCTPRIKRPTAKPCVPSWPRNARRDGSGPDAGWILTGQKTFISSAIAADFVIVAARTDPEAGSRGFSLLVVERDMPGFERGRKLEKVGLHSQDTGELYFTGVR